MTPEQLMATADALRTVKLLAEASSEAVLLLDGADERVTDQIIADIDSMSAAAASAALAIAKAYPDFPRVIQRAERAAENRARLLMQKGGGA